jgi:hypothetical protein
MDLGLLAALMGAFANDDARLFLGGRFDGEGMTVPLLFPAGSAAICACSARSPIEDGSGHVRVREALRVLVANRWVEG